MLLHPAFAFMRKQTQGPFKPKLQGQFADFPQLRLILHTLGFSPRGTSVGSWYEYLNFLNASFSWSPGISLILHTKYHSNLNLVLIITILPRFIVISTTDKLCKPSPKSQKQFLCYHTYLDNTGILTCFPFPSFLLGIRLGSITPWLIYIVKEPLPFRWQWFSHCTAPTTTRILYSSWSTNLFRLASAQPECLPTTLFAEVYSIGD